MISSSQDVPPMNLKSPYHIEEMKKSDDVAKINIEKQTLVSKLKILVEKPLNEQKGSATSDFEKGKVKIVFEDEANPFLSEEKNIAQAKQHVFVNNDEECQLYFPLIMKAFIFRTLDKVVDITLANLATNKNLFNFYVKQSKPQYEMWSLKCLSGVMVGKPFNSEGFANVYFRGFRGAINEVFDFILAGLPQMNHYDWIVLLSIVAKDPIKYEPIFQVLRSMIRGYIQEVGKMDVEIVKKLNRKPIVKPLDKPKVFENQKIGFIEKEPWSIVYQTRESEANRVPETQFQSSQPEHFQFRDSQNVEFESSSDDPVPERNEEETSEELRPVVEKKRTFTNRQKSKKWVEREELALARAYVDCSQDKQRGNQQRFDAFWDRVLENFNVQIGGSDRTRHQVNSKWKDLQKKCNAFNCIYNRGMNSVASRRSEADVLKASPSEYRSTINQKSFPHQKAWEWLKDHAK
ncbi:unnamed protein product [Lactuca saligna]|uniref:Myb-like domain-containing protein n=1 Tax=Lactuca saligna TaxID=75948 RepID=A0AA35YJX5_LACSI|nr:unnamed protein product [Lactuca saligna]